MNACCARSELSSPLSKPAVGEHDVDQLVAVEVGRVDLARRCLHVLREEGLVFNHGAAEAETGTSSDTSSGGRER
jgi:hypothetical protein